MSDQGWLERALASVGAKAGTVHRRRDAVLALTAAFGIPASVCAVVETIPRGKGMAGLAWARDAPVETCDLQSDETGDLRPGAKAVEARAAVALPVHDAGGEVRAVVGFAFQGDGAAAVSALVTLAEGLPVDRVRS